MRYLIIDTSGSKNFLALIVGQQTLMVDLPSRELSKILHPSLITLCEKSKISIKDLDFIAICNGPGLFTGVRIGVSVAKALAYANDLPLIPFHSLELLPRDLREMRILHAGGKNVYYAIGDELPSVISIDALLDEVPPHIHTLVSLDPTPIETRRPIDFPIRQVLPLYRSQENIWVSRYEKGVTDDFLTLSIHYRHSVLKNITPSFTMGGV